MTDVVMVDIAAAGEEAACVWLVEEHHGPMLRTAYVITGDPELAREATQIAWTKAWRRIRSLRQPDRVRAWLVAIAANEARQLVRARGRRVVHEVSSVTVGTPIEPGAGIDVLDLRRAVSRLGLEDQGILALRFVAGLGSSEIGAQIGMSASGVRSRLARLLERLRRDLDDA
jgi:RNA polymerase sigma-70 factor (ECF subfamily)